MKRIAIKKKRYNFYGGPYNLDWVLMASPGTLPIRVGNWFGYYNANMEWRDL